MWASYELFEGHLDEAASWYWSRAPRTGGTVKGLLAADVTECSPSAYAGDPTTADVADDLLADVGDARTPHAAYAWYCAGEADLSVDLERARARLGRALELAEQTKTSFVAGVAGASKASIDARMGDPIAAAADYRRLINHWRRAGMWSTQWTMLRAVAGLLARLERPRDAAVLGRCASGRRAPDTASSARTRPRWPQLEPQLRLALGDEEYEAALAEGAALDGDAAVELALRAL